jgi:hypothetical protein
MQGHRGGPGVVDLVEIGQPTAKKIELGEIGYFTTHPPTTSKPRIKLTYPKQYTNIWLCSPRSPPAKPTMVEPLSFGMTDGYLQSL